jgi:alkanesulfonate monooxygenase SsuD/methylene tetrahydromethanopterin reductase-like flavin-dependent oxidoreductase (luciferase family)
MTTLAAICRPSVPPERLRDLARAAEGCGLEELWLWEDCFWGGAASATAAVLAWTERLRVGIGVLPVPLRNVALTAMEAAMLHRLFPGRVIVGVGHGVQDWMGRYVRLDDVALGWPPAPAPAIFAAAAGPRTLRLSGELADGTVLDSSITPAGLREARQLIDQGRAAAGRTGPHPLVVYLKAITGPGASDRLAKAISDQSVRPDSAVVAGDAPAVAAAVHSWAENGTDTVALYPPSDDDPVAFVRFAAQQIRPLLS